MTGWKMLFHYYIKSFFHSIKRRRKAVYGNEKKYFQVQPYCNTWVGIPYVRWMYNKYSSIHFFTETWAVKKFFLIFFFPSLELMRSSWHYGDQKWEFCFTANTPQSYDWSKQDYVNDATIESCGWFSDSWKSFCAI